MGAHGARAGRALASHGGRMGRDASHGGRMGRGWGAMPAMAGAWGAGGAGAMPGTPAMGHASQGAAACQGASHDLIKYDGHINSITFI